MNDKMRPTNLSDQAARVFARHMNMEPRFDMAESATFHFYGLKIVVTKEPDDICLAAERQQAFESADKTYEETP